MKLILLLTFVLVSYGSFSDGGKSSKKEGKQHWAYVEVRPGAFMFYWLYYTKGVTNYTQKPWVIWLIGGPGVSGVGSANFRTIGPLHVDLTDRKHSWVTEANVLFIDSPVGSGFSYVKDTELLPRNNSLVAYDLVETVTKFLENVPAFKTIPLHIFGESYGAKMAAEFAVELDKKIKIGKIKCNLKGVTLGSPFISVLDSVSTWPSYLYTMSKIDGPGREELTASAHRLKSAMDMELYLMADLLYTLILTQIQKLTNRVNSNNILLPPDDVMVPFCPSANFMNGHVRDVLKIIPEKVIWKCEALDVYVALGEEILRPGVKWVDKLLKHTDIAVNVYCGQMDFIANVLATTQWVERLDWSGIPHWKNAPRIPLSHNNETEMFVQSYKKFGFYWILNAGHMVPNDQLEVSLRLLQLITNHDE